MYWDRVRLIQSYSHLTPYYIWMKSIVSAKSWIAGRFSWGVELLSAVLRVVFFVAILLGLLFASCDLGAFGHLVKCNHRVENFVTHRILEVIIFNTWWENNCFICYVNDSRRAFTSNLFGPMIYIFRSQLDDYSGYGLPFIL